MGSHLISVDHAYTHFRITLHVYWCRYLSGLIRNLGIADHKWITAEELRSYAFPAADRKVIEKLEQIKEVSN